jgi:hypothetical protein
MYAAYDEFPFVLDSLSLMVFSTLLSRGNPPGTPIISGGIMWQIRLDIIYGVSSHIVLV